MFKSASIVLLLMLPAWAHADGTITGWVRPMGYIEPLYPVAIQVIDPVTGAAVPGLNTVNDEDGTYELSGIPEGDYKVLYYGFDETKYYLAELTGNVVCDNGDCDRVALGNVVHIGNGTTKLNIMLAQGAPVTGEITDTAGKPLSGVTVEFYDRDGEPYCCKRVSDENGYWVRPVAPFDTYYAVARFAEPSDYQPQVYPGQPCSGCEVTALGTPIDVDYRVRRGIDFELPQVEVDPSIARVAVDARKFSGSWFDPDRAGEGYIVEVLNQAGPGGEGQAVVVFWFTYTPDGRQAWMVGVGGISEGVAKVDFEITDGTSFGAGFDPQDVRRRMWGSLNLDFLDCNQAQAQYAGDYGSGQLALTRLTAIHGLGCTGAEDAKVLGKSGAWFNPSRDGEGIIVEVIGKSEVLAYWFTYDTDGSQMWMLGTGELDAGLGTHLTMQRTAGGRFGDRFDAASVVLENWGEVSLQFGTCDDASYTWQAPPPYDSGGFGLSRLTALQIVPC